MNENRTAGDPIRAIAALEEPKRRQLYEFAVSQPEPVSRDRAAAALRMSRELAAFHLDRLVEAGLLVAEFRRLGPRPGQGGGRPSKLYRRSPGTMAATFPPRRYEEAALVFAEALSRAGADDRSANVATVARSRGREAGTEARAAEGKDAALVSLLARCGYEPAADPDDEGRLYLRNCPFHDLAQRYRELTCGMNLAWAQGVVEGLGDPDLSVEMTQQEGRCCLSFDRTGGRGRRGTPAQ